MRYVLLCAFCTCTFCACCVCICVCCVCCVGLQGSCEGRCGIHTNTLTHKKTQHSDNIQKHTHPQLASGAASKEGVCACDAACEWRGPNNQEKTNRVSNESYFNDDRVLRKKQTNKTLYTGDCCLDLAVCDTFPLVGSKASPDPAPVAVRGETGLSWAPAAAAGVDNGNKLEL